MPATLFRSATALVFTASLIAATQAASAATPVELQKARHEHYEELGKAFKAVRDASKEASPDFAAIEKAAETVSKATVDQQQWFPKGTGPEAGKTRALPEIWSKPDDFTAAQKMFSERAPKLLAAAKTKDVAAITAAFKDVGGACKNCHDTFRKPED
jgi:cytochrome c556